MNADVVLSTIDFFTPVVESPFDFGRIAAANALSDIYAMGGEPLFALNVVGFPTEKLPLSVLAEILRGGAETAREAGIPILGGHSTDFDVPVYGMAVTGRSVVSRIRRNIGAKAGDALVLTKAIGTGILTSALRARALATLFGKRPSISPEEEAAAIRSMARLNAEASRRASPFRVSASTDVTGYGLLGHLAEVLRGSGVAGEVLAPSVPLLEGARRLAGQGIAPDGSRRNLDAIRAHLEAGSGVTDLDLLLLADAQTSGGLLFSVDAGQAPSLVGALHAGGDAAAAVIGRVVEGERGKIAVVAR